jgi:serine/threonine-protein kinase
MMAHVNERPRPPSELRGDLPPELQELILDAMAKEPGARPSSCEEFVQRLDRALGGEPSRARAATSSVVPQVLRSATDGEMVLVPAGPFLMGKQKRAVQMDAFYIDRAPVTNREFARFLQVTGYRPTDPAATRFVPQLLSRRLEKRDENHPVVYVSWFDARAYASWVGKRLPSEAEWEKAARGTDGRKYPWGRAEPSKLRANFGNQGGGTVAVASLPDGASPYGVLDLAGNVWEWCEDYDDPEFYQDGPSNNPINHQRGERRVMRGGSYLFGASALRTYARTSFEPYYRFASGGFRCARSI